jgi:phosphate transport system substrate-binding protein
MNELAGLKSLPTKNVYSFKTNEEVIKFIAENDGMIGFVGLNYLYQPSVAVAGYLKNINVLSVK